MGVHSIRLLSLIVGAILATFGIIRNDLLLLIPAMIISPIGGVLNDIAFSAVTFNTNDILFNLMILAVMGIISFLIAIRYAKYHKKKIDRDKMKKFPEWRQIRWLHITIAFILGMFTAYLVSASKDDPSAIQPQLVGIGIAITLLPPIVDIGLQFGQKDFDKKDIYNDLKIVLGNMLPFFFGAGIIHYWFIKKRSK